jgi:hypothetical protein
MRLVAGPRASYPRFPSDSHHPALRRTDLLEGWISQAITRLPPALSPKGVLAFDHVFQYLVGQLASLPASVSMVNPYPKHYPTDPDKNHPARIVHQDTLPGAAFLGKPPYVHRETRASPISSQTDGDPRRKGGVAHFPPPSSIVTFQHNSSIETPTRPKMHSMPEGRGRASFRSCHCHVPFRLHPSKIPSHMMCE